MSKKERKTTNLEEINEALTSSEQFIEENQNTIMITLGLIIVVVLSVLAYHNLYKKPKNERSQAALFKGECYF